MSTTIDEATASPASPARPRAEVLRRADGIELIGEFEDSGYREPPHIARRADGQVVQLSELLYAVADASDGERDVHAVADEVSERVGKTVSADNVVYVADRKLRPLGVLALADGSTPELPKREPMMALRHRRPLLPERVVNAGARLFTWLHLPFVTTLALVALAAFDAWLFGIHGVAGGLRSALYNPELLLIVLGSIVVATMFHEFGHASACRYGGARPGVMGVGLYLVWPAFYCDVTDAYRLDRRGRLRTDLGGVYFNALFALLAGGVYFATGEEAALLAAFAQHMIMLQQLLPLLRFDGYYVLTDLTGVPDILERIKPILRSLFRGRKREPKVMELKRWVRFVVTGYLVALVPTLLFFFAWMVMGFPRVLATVYDSFGLQIDRIGSADGVVEAAAGVVRTLMLVLPVAAMSLSLSRTTRMAGRGLVGWSRGSALRGATAALVAVAVAGAVGYILWPNGDYEPIRPGERGTIGQALKAIPDAPGGRPFYTPADEISYGNEPTEREAAAAQRRGEEPAGAPGSAPSSEDDSGTTPPSDDGGGDGSIGGGWVIDGGDSSAPAPSGSPSDSGTTTQTQPPPADSGTTTTEPAPTSPDSTSTTPTEPAPTTTETTPSEPPPTETSPTEPLPDSSGSSTTTTPTAPDALEAPSSTTPTVPETTTVPAP